MGAVTSAWVAGGCNPALGEELAGGEEKLHFERTRDAEVKGPNKWRIGSGSPMWKSKQCVWKCKAAWGQKGRPNSKCAETNLIKGGIVSNVESPACVSRRSPHLRAISLRAIKKWEI